MFDLINLLYSTTVYKSILISCSTTWWLTSKSNTYGNKQPQVIPGFYLGQNSVVTLRRQLNHGRREYVAQMKASSSPTLCLRDLCTEVIKSYQIYNLRCSDRIWLRVLKNRLDTSKKIKYCIILPEWQTQLPWKVLTLSFYEVYPVWPKKDAIPIWYIQSY
jgi:hypothetical protein